MTLENPLTIPASDTGLSTKAKGEIIRQRFSIEIRQMYLEGFGHKLISRKLKVSDMTVRRILVEMGIYKPGSIPRKGNGVLFSVARERRTQRKWQEAAWRDEWRGVVEDYTGMYLRILKEREKASVDSLAKYRAMSQEERKKHNRNMVARQGEKRRLRAKEWRKRNKSWTNEYQNNRAKNPTWRIRLRTAGRIYEAIKGNYTAKTEKSKHYVGCSWAELRSHLERQFKRGMTWDNYGPAWHIDHRIPCAAFDLTREDELQRCFHFTNLQPMWAVENMRKGARFKLGQPALI